MQYNIDEIKNSILVGNVLDELKKIPDGSIDMVFTSPPYWCLRNYGGFQQIWGGNPNCEHDWETGKVKGTSGGTKSKKVQIKGKKNFQITPDSQYKTCKKCGAWFGDLGQEPAVKLFIDHLLEIFSEVKRVLKDSGTCYVNLGDTYAANRTYQVSGTKQIKGSQPNYQQPQAKDSGIIEKSLCGVPDRFKIGMIDSGWICRNEIIWHKPNQMPTSAKDRFAVDFEKVYFFTKTKDYYFEQQLEPYTKPLDRWGGDELKASGSSTWDKGTGQETYRKRNMRPNPKGRTMRSVWSINTKAFKGAHFAVFPEKLLEVPIVSSCPENGVVLDIFFGSGTTGVVAKKLNRNWIGIELKPDYADIAKKRLKE